MVEKGGDELIDTLVTLTGLPKEQLCQELDQILERSGIPSGEHLTLEGLRFAMLTYLEELSSDVEVSGSPSGRLHN